MTRRERGRTNESPYSWSSDWIHHLEPEEHWRAYWRQQSIMEGRVNEGDHVLEIGVGSGFTANYLRSKGVRVTTVDIDEKKRPDIVANVAEHDFPDTYDHILAYEVFEHLPYDDLLRALPHISRSVRRHLFLSVPACEVPRIEFSCNIPFIGKRTKRILTKRRKITTRNHHWELGHKEHTERRFIDDVESAGFSLEHRVKPRSLVYFVFAKEDAAVA